MCDSEVPWVEAEIHHIKEHSQGGQTVLENGKLVHKQCHPKAPPPMSLQHRSGIIPRSHSAEGRVTESEPGQAQAIGSLFKNRRPAVRMRLQGDPLAPISGRGGR